MDSASMVIAMVMNGDAPRLLACYVLVTATLIAFGTAMLCDVLIDWLAVDTSFAKWYYAAKVNRLIAFAVGISVISTMMWQLSIY